jgi:hypothetical protein
MSSYQRRKQEIESLRRSEFAMEQKINILFDLIEFARLPENIKKPYMDKLKIYTLGGIEFDAVYRCYLKQITKQRKAV